MDRNLTGWWFLREVTSVVVFVVIIVIAVVVNTNVCLYFYALTVYFMHIHSTKEILCIYAHSAFETLHETF